MRNRQLRAAAGSTALLVAAGLTTGLVAGQPATASSGAGSGAGTVTEAADGATAGAVVDWNTTALRTVFTEAASPIPVGSLYLGFTSLAVYDAVRDATRPRAHGPRTSVAAAAATAAHDVLAEYFPASTANLDADLATSLAAVPDGRAENRGIRVGRAAAEDMIASRVDDGRPTPEQPSTRTFDKPPAIGVWRPTPPSLAPMAVPWLGFVDPLVLDSATQVRPAGPDPVTSSDYAVDFLEVKWMGALEGSLRTDRQTDTALFYNYNAILQYESALADALGRHPLPGRATARLFAVVNASIADALIGTWRLKYDVGFWRPITAIHEAAADGNPATDPDPAWRPLADAPPQAGTPPYPENSSGHATITNAFTTALHLFTGRDRTHLLLYSGVTDSTRLYTSLRRISRDAFHARIWLGLHFRQAMLDGRYVGRTTARIVSARLD